MGIREKLEQHRTLALGVSVLVIAATWGWFFWSSATGANDGRAIFITTDDGKTYFRDTSGQLAPFDYRGKTAVKAKVFTVDGGMTSFVGYLERYTPEGKKLLASGGKDTNLDPTSLMSRLMANTEVKRPGDAQWVREGNFAKSSEITLVRGPDGKPAEPVIP